MKMLLLLGVVQLLLAPVLMVPSVDYWDSWGLYGECSRSCGGGVAMRTRRCITHRTDGEHNCVGQDKTYRSCNTQYCPEGSRDFREEQCSQFDGTDFQGKRYTWLPYYGADNPCELNCIPKGENFYYRHRSAVVDGTPCHPGRRDVCVAGVCKRLGCDNTLKSSQQEDPCLQCGGNGASCHRVQNSFSVRSLPTGYNQMFIIPVGATSISIRETVATRNYLAIKNLRGEYYLNGHWVIEFSRATPVAGTTLYYQRGPEGDSVPETIIGRGPTTEPLVVELISQEPNQGVEYEFYLPNGRSTEGYHWSFGSWSACSTDCGSGHQSRLVFCSTDNEPYPDSLCASQPRPQTNRTCNPHPCPLTHRMAYLYPPQLMSSSESPKACVLSWTTGEWSACSVACGGGTQKRSVQCVSHDASGPRVVEDAVCAAYAEAPSTLQTCNSQSCYRPEAVPSIQDPQGRDNAQLFVSDRATATRRDTDPSTGLHCSQSYYGCCPDGRSAATGPQGQGCPQAQPSCIQTSYGCCQDGATAAQGPNKEGCVEYVAPALTVASLPAENAPQCRTTTYGCCYDRTTPAGGPDGDGCPNPPNHMARSICSLPRAAGSCSSWVTRYHYDAIASKCVHFWYGGCHGNSNNFMSQAECQRACQASATSQQGPQQSPQPGPSAHGRQAMSAARQAQSGRLYLRARRPSSVTAASLTLKGVSIDKSDPPAVEALVGQTVVLPCRVSPRPSSTVVVEWRRDGVPLSTQRHHQQPNGSLLVGPVSKSDSGWFLCVATRDRERDHRYVYLSVSEGSSPPISSSLPKDGPSLRFSIDRSSSSLLEMRAGQTATLPCTVVPPSALQSVRIQWTKDGRPLSDSRFTQKSDGTLIVGPLKSGDSGVYTCTASSQQQLDQRQLQLRVQADLKITMAPNDVRVSEGSTALLPCVVSADDVNIGWSRNGVPIRPDGRDILQSSDGSLILNNVKPSDAGTYTCNAYTGIYSVSATADVKVIKDAQQEPDVPPECVDQPDLANCELIVYARLCSNSYYSSFCCASCTRQRNARFARLG